MTGYKEDEYLMISGIQHFVFCKRQWALIHIEQLWEDNLLTIEGHHVHEKVDEPMIREKRGSKVYVRALPIHSPTLGINGICDMVEFTCNENGISIHGESGLFLPKPVEYKRGKPKQHQADILQLVAQVMCLEEMLVTKIEQAELYYHEIRRRQQVTITDELRERVKIVTKEMHNYYKRRHTPRVKPDKHCNSCSLRHVCLPKMMERETVKNYLDRLLSE